MGESGGSAERKAQQLTASGDAEAGAWAAGAEGERRVAAALGALPGEFVVLHDRLLTPGISESNLDHLVVGPGGVVMVDAKNWAGAVTEWEGNLMQHRRKGAGETTHESKHAEIAKVHAMGREMAERLRVPVAPVLCLAGARASEFGEARQVRGVWVVPVDRLGEWVRSRQRVVPGADLHRLATLVRTEFPSTTTDPELLAAMGADLARDRPTRGRRRPGRAEASQPTRRARREPARRPSGRRRAQTRSDGVRLLVAAGLVAAMWWGVTQGLLTALSQAAGDAVAGAVRNSVEGGTLVSPPDRLSCDDVDPTTIAALDTAHVAPRPSLSGCHWVVPDGKGAEVRAVSLLEIVGASEKLNPMLERSRAAAAPQVVDSFSPQGKVTVVWVAAGVPVSSARKAPDATRSMSITVSRELLGLSDKEARRLAMSIAEAASVRHAPMTPTPPG